MGNETQEHKEALLEFSKLAERWFKERELSHFLIVGNNKIGFAFLTNMRFKDEETAAKFAEFHARYAHNAFGTENDMSMENHQRKWSDA